MRRQTFFVGGNYIGSGLERVMQGQMYVEILTPDTVEHNYPLIFVHGNGQTAVNWLSTPDNRPGWAEWFLEKGWRVVLVDQPARGRSAWQPKHDGEPKMFSVPFVEALFTACSEGARWPQAKLHTQWPGGANKGHEGDPVFDQFYASQVPSVSGPESQVAMRIAGAALLDRIGPAILVGHSQGGMLSWLIADERPALVKGIVALEPSGPPYKDASLKSGAPDRLWGLAASPLTYDPPVTSENPLRFERASTPEVSGLAVGWRQQGSPRKLVNLATVPMLIVTAEASYHAEFDHCTVEYLQQAGVAVDFVRLADQGLHGNGHMMMLELNNLHIAAIVNRWLVDLVDRIDSRRYDKPLR